MVVTTGRYDGIGVSFSFISVVCHLSLDATAIFSFVMGRYNKPSYRSSPFGRNDNKGYNL